MFHLRQIDIRGATLIPSDDIFNRLEVTTGVSIWEISTKDIEQRITHLPGVERVRVHRRLPSTLIVSIHESPPVAYTIIDGQQFIVTRSGHFLQSPHTHAAKSLPRMKLNSRKYNGDNADNKSLLAITQSLFLLQSSTVPWQEAILEIEPLPDHGYSIILEEPYNTKLLLPTDTKLDTLALFEVIWADFNETYGDAGRAIHAIDLRFSGQAIVRY